MPLNLSVTEIQQERAELLKKANALHELAKKEGRDMTAEEKEQFDAWMTSHDALEDDLTRAQNFQKAMEARHSGPRDDPPQHQPSSNPADVPPQTTIPATVRRTRLTNFRGRVANRDAEERAYRFGMWALARLSYDMPERFSFPTATSWVKDNMGVVFGASMGEGGADTSGAGVFVPDETSMDMIRLRELYGVAGRLFRSTTMLYETKTIPRWRTAMTVYWRGENLSGTEGNPKYDDIRLTARSLTGISRMSRELDADSVISLGDELVGEAAYAFSEKEDQAAFNGDGTSTYGGQRGVRGALDTLTAGTAPGLILGAGNAYSELTQANFRSAIAALPQYADTPMTSWVCHRTFYYDVMLGLILAAGGTEAREITDPGVRARPMFMGYPVEFSQVYPSTAANSQIPVTLGDYSQGAVIGRRSGMEINFSEQASVGGESLWERNQIGVRTIERLHINVHDFGSDTVAGPIVGIEMAAS